MPFLEGACGFVMHVLGLGLGCRAMGGLVLCACLHTDALILFIPRVSPVTSIHTDPNTGVSLFESADIIEYLRENYGPSN